jgi:predicted site-specific integrase-resolvase
MTLSVTQAAILAGTSADIVRRFAREQRIPASRAADGSWRIPAEAIPTITNRRKRTTQT